MSVLPRWKEGPKSNSNTPTDHSSSPLGRKSPIDNSNGHPGRRGPKRPAGCQGVQSTIDI